MATSSRNSGRQLRVTTPDLRSSVARVITRASERRGRDGIATAQQESGDIVGQVLSHDLVGNLHGCTAPGPGPEVAQDGSFLEDCRELIRQTQAAEHSRRQTLRSASISVVLSPSHNTGNSASRLQKQSANKSLKSARRILRPPPPPGYRRTPLDCTGPTKTRLLDLLKETKDLATEDQNDEFEEDIRFAPMIATHGGTHLTEGLARVHGPVCTDKTFGFGVFTDIPKPLYSQKSNFSDDRPISEASQESPPGIDAFMEDASDYPVESEPAFIVHLANDGEEATPQHDNGGIGNMETEEDGIMREANSPHTEDEEVAFEKQQNLDSGFGEHQNSDAEFEEEEDSNAEFEQHEDHEEASEDSNAVVEKEDQHTRAQQELNGSVGRVQHTPAVDQIANEHGRQTPAMDPNAQVEQQGQHRGAEQELVGSVGRVQEAPTMDQIANGVGRQAPRLNQVADGAPREDQEARVVQDAPLPPDIEDMNMSPNTKRKTYERMRKRRYRAKNRTNVGRQRTSVELNPVNLTVQTLNGEPTKESYNTLIRELNQIVTNTIPSYKMAAEISEAEHYQIHRTLVDKYQNGNDILPSWTRDRAVGMMKNRRCRTREKVKLYQATNPPDRRMEPPPDVTQEEMNKFSGQLADRTFQAFSQTMQGRSFTMLKKHHAGNKWGRGGQAQAIADHMETNGGIAPTMVQIAAMKRQKELAYEAGQSKTAVQRRAALAQNGSHPVPVEEPQLQPLLHPPRREGASSASGGGQHLSTMEAIQEFSSNYVAQHGKAPGDAEVAAFLGSGRRGL